MHVDHTLASGRVVGLRPITWQEYWDIQKKHLMGLKALEDKKAEISNLDHTLEFVQLQRDMREGPLSLCVNEWDSIKGILTMPEVVEVENAVRNLSRIEILSGNSGPAAAAVPAEGPSTAASA